MGEKFEMRKLASKDTVALLISVMCVVGVVHVEWKSVNCESRQFVHCKSNMEDPESDMSDGK